MKQLHKTLGAPMIYVTHDQVEAMTLATRIAVMKTGGIQQVDTPAGIYSRPCNMFVAGFLGSPSMNFIEGRLSGQAGRVSFESAALKVDVSDHAFAPTPQHGRAAVLGIRPESLSLAPPSDAVATAPAPVVLVEPMGASPVAWLDVAGTSLAANLEATAQPIEGSDTGSWSTPAACRCSTPTARSGCRGIRRTS